MPRKYFTPGFTFKEGRLYIFTDDTVMLVRGWPDPEAVIKRPGSRSWDPFTPRFRLVHPYRRAPKPKKKKSSPQLTLFTPEQLGKPKPTPAQRRKRAFDGFRFSLPKPVANALQDFQRNQWEPLLCLHRWGETMRELFDANPVLGFLLAHHRCFRTGRSSRVPEKIIRGKQREILEWLGLPSSKSAVKLIRKIAPESVGDIDTLNLREIFDDVEAIKLLSHAPKINTGVLALVSDPLLRGSVTLPLLEEVAADRRQKYSPRTARLLDYVLTVHRVLHPGNARPRFKSVDKLVIAHDKLSAEFLRSQPDIEQARRFPRPPVRGTPDIVPIKTYRDLVLEGESQCNCVASYAHRVVARTTYIYRVMRPERATLSLVITSGGRWVMDQLLCRDNVPVKPRTEAMVEDWLMTHAYS